jgi:hypothetical protein
MREKVDPEIAEILMPEEDIILVVSQSKAVPGGALYSPNKLYITNNRVLFKDPKWFGLKANIIDVSYANISTVVLKRGIFTTEIYVKPKSSSQNIHLAAVDKKVAMQASMFIKKGMKGETFSDHRQQEVKSDERQDGTLNRLEKLAHMCQEGLITEQEFRIMKKELMSGTRAEEGLNPMIETDAYCKSANMALPEHHVQQLPDSPKGPLSCRYCNRMNLPTGAKFCSECGHGIVEETRVRKMCPVCDTLMTGDSTFCTSCNKKLFKTLS